MTSIGDDNVSSSTIAASGGDYDLASCSSSGGTVKKQQQNHSAASNSVSSRLSKDCMTLIAESINEGQLAGPGPCNEKIKLRSEKLKCDHCSVCQYIESASKLFFKYLKQNFKQTLDNLCQCENKTFCQCADVYQTAALNSLCIKHKNDFIISVKGNFFSRSSPGVTKQEKKEYSNFGIKGDLDDSTKDEDEDDIIDEDDLDDIIDEDDLHDSIEDDDLDGSIGDDELADILKGFSECQPGLLHVTMRSHLQSRLHSVSYELCGKSNKVFENLFAVAQFFSENCISEDAYQQFLSVATKMIKNVTVDERDFVPPFGNNVDDNDDDAVLRSNFLFDKEKKKYFCIQCLRYQSTRPDLLEENVARWADSKQGGAGSSKCWARKEKLGQVLDSKFVENLCLFGHFFASFYMPDILYHKFCALLNIIAKNVSLLKENNVHPLGSFVFSIKTIANAKQACYQSCKEEIQNKFKRLSSATNELPKFTLAVQTSLAEEGNLRIYVVGSYVGEEGLPQEIMLSAACLRGKKPMCESKHLKLKVADMVNPKQIAVIASNRESLRKLAIKKKKFKKKTEQDILSDLKAVGFHEKLIYLQDISSLCENLLLSTSPSWVRDAMLECGKVYRSLNNPRIASLIQEYANMNESMNICFSPPECCDDISFMSKGLAEFWYLKISCVLENVEIIAQSLPPFVQVLEGFHTLEADSVLKIVCNPAFIAKLLVLEHVFKQLFLIENAAKDVSFTSFDYIRVINHMKSEFEAGCFSVLQKANSLLVTGIYLFNLDSSSKTKQRSINLADIRSKCYPSLTEEINADDFGTMFRDWISSMVDHVDDHITIPECFLLISCIFGDDDKSVNERAPYFRRLFSLLPVDFAICSKDCRGIQECTCVMRELERFFSHMHDFIKTSSSLCKDEQQKPVCKKVFAHYLAQDNVEQVQKLNVVNVLRALEVIQLMKASNSGMQRVASVISEYFRIDENPFKYSKHLKLDIIDISAFLAMNSDIQKMNATVCCQKYLAAYGDPDEGEWEDVKEEEEEEEKEEKEEKEEDNIVLHL